MAHDTLKKLLEELPDPSYCEGTQELGERFAIQLPDGDVGALDDKMFVEWLLEHSEAAPFGHGNETKRDKKVRHAKRLVARGKASVSGFDPADVLPAIEKALSPRTHLDARLEDVIVYPKGGKFATHKDTPRSENLVGTLVVGLPIAHEGGQFEIADGTSAKPYVVDWSGKKPDPTAVKWVALFSDVDHAVKAVTSGARVTLVYSLTRSDRPRADATRDKRLQKLRAAVKTTRVTKGDPLMIACTRQIVTDGSQPQSIETLRGTDREIADVFVEAGHTVGVRACIVTTGERERPFPDTQHLWSITRLGKAIPRDLQMDYLVSFTDSIDADEYMEEGDEPPTGTLLGEYVLDYTRMDCWVVRKRAAATIIHEGMFSETGYFGNEAGIGLIYTLAAIEVTPGKAKKAKQKPAAPKKPAAAKKKPAAAKKKPAAAKKKPKKR